MDYYLYMYIYIDMFLKDIVDNYRSDKNTVHSYLPLYETLMINKKETAKNILEIGIRPATAICTLHQGTFRILLSESSRRPS